MTVDETRAGAVSTYGGTTYYFCSRRCREDFEADPGTFVEDGADSP